MYDENNVFAKIIRGEIPAKKVYEDEKILCFYDVRPMSKIHVLIIPKGKYVDFSDFAKNANTEDFMYFFKKIDEIAENLSLKSYKLITNKGEPFQEVFHFHVHLMDN